MENFLLLLRSLAEVPIGGAQLVRRFLLITLVLQLIAESTSIDLFEFVEVIIIIVNMFIIVTTGDEVALVIQSDVANQIAILVLEAVRLMVITRQLVLYSFLKILVRRRFEK